MLLERVEASVTTDDGRRLIAQVRQSEADYTAGVERVLSASGSQADALRAFQQEVPLLRTKLSRACDALLAASVDEVKVLLARADQSAARARTLSYLSTALALGLGALVVQRLTREVDRRFGQEERALHLRDEFLSAASHELKTPLTTLTLQLESLNRALGTESASNPRVTRAMEKMRTQTRRLVQLIESLLDVSRLQAGRLPLERRQVDLVTLVREAAAELDPQFTQAGVPLRLEAAGPVVGEFDPLRLHLVVTNLLSNAVKYGGGSPVDVTVAHVEGAALLRVADAGPGIAPEDQQRIFERFERASHMGGTGVGLWLVRELVGAHGGRVLLESAPGRGASFTITLPLTSPPHALPR
jgi:signal transduction histidine kinase